MENSYTQTVLIVDDMPQNVQIVGKLLTENDINSVAALNGKDAIEIANNQPIDLILLDIQMPGMDGFEVCRRLKVNEATTDIPVIFLTAYNQSNDIVKGLNFGAVDYITKPFNDVELLQRIKLHLQLRRTQTELEQSVEKIKTSEKKIKESEKYYKTLFFDNQMVNLLIDYQSGKITDANNTACKYYGYSYEEICRLIFWKMNNGDNENSDLQIEKTSENEKWQFVTKHRLKNGNERHVEVYTKQMTIGNNKFIHAVVFDIEEKVRAEKENQKLLTAVEQSPVTIVITNTDGEIEYANPAFSKITGYTINEALGKNPRILKSEKTPKETFKSLWSTIKSGNVWSGEFYNKRKDGSFFWEYAVIAPVRNKQNKITHYVAVKEDITIRKEAEEKLQALNDKLKDTNNELSLVNEKLNTEREQLLALLESIPENIHVTDKETYEIIFANKTMHNTFGEDIIGKKCHCVVQKKEAQCSFCPDSIFKNPDRPHYRENYNKKLGKHFYVIDRALKWTDGRDVRFEMAIDITKLKETEEALRNREQELSELNATKDKFFSIIAHDLKNPFNTILGFSDLLQRYAHDSKDDKLKKYSDLIQSSTKRAYKLLQNLLEWSRSQMGRVAFNPESHQLKRLLEVTIGALRGQADAKEIEIEHEINSNIMVFADENMLNTIIRNLISNAIKFTPRNGKVTIDANLNGGFVQISVTDTGVGMPQSTVDKLFKINEKVTSGGTENEHGTGLGLLLCKEFVDKHNGNIVVKSEEGKGSEFTIKIPVNIDE